MGRLVRAGWHSRYADRAPRSTPARPLHGPREPHGRDLGCLSLRADGSGRAQFRLKRSNEETEGPTGRRTAIPAPRRHSSKECDRFQRESQRAAVVSATTSTTDPGRRYGRSRPRCGRKAGKFRVPGKPNQPGPERTVRSGNGGRGRTGPVSQVWEAGPTRPGPGSPRRLAGPAFVRIRRSAQDDSDGERHTAAGPSRRRSGSPQGPTLAPISGEACGAASRFGLRPAAFPGLGVCSCTAVVSARSTAAASPAAVARPAQVDRFPSRHRTVPRPCPARFSASTACSRSSAIS